MQRQQTKVANSKFHLDVRILVYEIQETLETREATFANTRQYSNNVLEGAIRIKLLQLVHVVPENPSDHLNDGNDKTSKGTSAQVVATRPQCRGDCGGRKHFFVIRQEPLCSSTGNCKISDCKDEGLPPEKSKKMNRHQTL